MKKIEEVNMNERNSVCHWYEPCDCRCVVCPLEGQLGWCTEAEARVRIQKLTQSSLQDTEVDKSINNKLKINYSEKALTGVKSINVNIADYTDSKGMKEAIDKSIHNLKQLRQVV